MSKLLDSLTDVLGQQLNIAENKLHTLDTTNKDGSVNQYGRLGEFAKNIDQSAERHYVEGGYHRNDLFNPKVNASNILFQEPEFTVLIKKRAFSSLAENYRNDSISDEEKLFLRATKFLFQNKANQISAYEKLSKISQITSKTGTLDDALLPTLFASSDILSDAGSFGGSDSSSKFKDAVDRVRTLYNLSEDAKTTTWVTNSQDSFSSTIGEGTGVLEFTTALSFNTSVGIGFGTGQGGLNFTDPLKLMQITSNDIEKAIADATNAVLGASFVQLGLDVLGTTIEQAKSNLNSLRSARGANPIIFTVNPDTYLGQRIVAIVDFSALEIKFEGSMFEVNIDPLSMDAAGSLSGDILSGEEVSLFKLIIKSLYNQLQINKNSQTTQRAHNKGTNALRKKLRLHYGGQLVIQPMDVVHIYVSSKTRADTKVLGGLRDEMSGVGFLQTLNKSLMNVEDFFAAGTDDSIEKSVFVGSDFPNWLWLLMRNQFTASKSGTHVFAGIVESANHSYNGTSYSVTAQLKDNTEYFKMGVINYQPALDVFNGSLYDPLTPFNIKFDNITGLPAEGVPELLPENQKLFNESIFAKYNKGIYVGKKPSINNFISDSERTKNGANRRVFYDPDGMVYKWKEGIGTLVMFGNNYQENPTTNTSNPSLTTDPFAGQDLMNVLSLLITGEPYNFATFYQAAIQFDNYGRDPQTGQDPSTSYLKNLQTSIKSRNVMYGNFIPFKKLSMDQDAYIKSATAQIRANQADSELNSLLQQKADLQDKYNAISNGGNDTGQNLDGSIGGGISVATLANDKLKEIQELDAKIGLKINSVMDSLSQVNSKVSVIGNDITMDPSAFMKGFNKNDQSDMTEQVRLHKKINFLTRRLAWKVRANEDVNYFIVDDTYDKDYDIQAFEKSFANAQLFKSDYVTVADQISRVASLFDLEIFANTQGHIEIRPPQYNRVPTSVFYRMMRLQQEFDIQLYPQFLEDLFVNQINSALKQVEVIEDELRLYGLLLGATDDNSTANFFSAQKLVTTGATNSNFSFISNNEGSISTINLDDMIAKYDPEKALNNFSGQLAALKSIETQTTINNIFSLTSRAKLLSKPFVLPQSSAFVVQREGQIVNRLLAKTGIKFDINQIVSGSHNYLQGTIASQVDMLRILDEIAQRIAKRQRLLKTALDAIKSAKQGLALMKNENGSADKLFSAGLVENSLIPQSLQYMLEDEGYDDYGPGSGKRFILNNSQIKSFTLSNNAPQHTVVTVTGTFGDNFEVSLPQDLSGFEGGGNALTTAEAVDYDMWRMYGVRKAQPIAAPYLSDPQSQCAPFAVSVLNKYRNQIHNGSAEIVGNEYMQPGEVVYLEDQDRLYYVDTVSHNVAFSGQFTTTLSLSAGHMIGEYIPTYLDTIGKVLYKNKEITNFVNKKQGNVNSEQHLGAFIGDVYGAFADVNRKTLNNVILSAQASLTGGNAKLELRTYIASNHGYPTSSATAISHANSYRELMVGAATVPGLGSTASSDIGQPFLSAFSSLIPQPTSSVVDADKAQESRSPSGKAYSLARDWIKNQSSDGDSDLAKIENVIFERVVDVWIVFQPIVDTNG